MPDKNMNILKTAYILGAQIIEKHYKIDDEMNCIDAAVSISEANMSKLVDEIRLLEDIIIGTTVDVVDVEKSSMIFRRQIK